VAGDPQSVAIFLAVSGNNGCRCPTGWPRKDLIKAPGLAWLGSTLLCLCPHSIPESESLNPNPNRIPLCELALLLLLPVGRWPSDKFMPLIWQR